jgi:hypothetical protein
VIELILHNKPTIKKRGIILYNSTLETIAPSLTFLEKRLEMAITKKGSIVGDIPPDWVQIHFLFSLPKSGSSRLNRTASKPNNPKA